MNIPSFSVKRPILTTMVAAIVVLVGVVSTLRIDVDLLPDIELPTLTVRTDFPGASPEVIESNVTQMVEEIVGTVPGVEEMTSESSEGESEVRVRFVWGTDIDTAALEVRSRLEDELNELPEEVERPQIRKFDIGSFPVVILGIASNIDPVELTELVTNQMRYRFTKIPGVAQADLWGEFQRELRIELIPDRLLAFDVPLDQVLQAIRNANINAPAGKIESGRYEISLRAPAELRSVEEVSGVVVAMRSGAPVTLGQIANVKDTYEKVDRIVRVNGVRGLRLAIRKQSSANTVQVAEAVIAEVSRLNEDFPQVEVTVVSNQGNFIERSITNVTRSVLYGGGLAVFVLLFFLLNIRSTAVIALSIPLSIVATLALIFFSGLTINLMSLGGLALGVGMMVDSSIVVLENIFRRRASEGSEDASIHGATEVATAIVASTITTLVVFLPLAFVRGVSGILFGDLAYVVVASLLCSLVVSLTLLPMLAARFLRREEKEPPRWARGAHDFARRSTELLEGIYGRILSSALNHRGRVIGGSAVLLVASFGLLPLIGSEFLPPSDEGEVQISGEMEVGTRLELVDRQSRIMEEVVRQAVPDAEATVASVGQSWGRSPAARGSLTVNLGPAAEREKSNVEIANELRRKLDGAIPGMEMRVRAPQGQFILQRILGGEEGMTIEIRGFDLGTLDALTKAVSAELDQVEGIADIQVSRITGVPENQITINREKVADLGLSVRDVSEALQTAVAGSQAGQYRVDGNSYRILVQLADITHVSMDQVLSMTLTTPTGQQVALRNLVSPTSGRAPLLIERKDQQRIVRIDANVASRDLGSVARDVQTRVAGIAKPVGYDILVGGSYEEQQKSSRELLISLVLAVLLVYMVLASQYESLTSPLVVMLSVPVAAVGVLVTLFITGTTLNVQSYIGCIMLGGIVVNNAILLVDQTERLIRDGHSVRDAVSEAGRRRLRPILMTTLTTILGLLPLALGIGEGADAQAPLARAVIGGLAASTPLTLLLVPAVYVSTHRDRRDAVAVAPNRTNEAA